MMGGTASIRLAVTETQTAAELLRAEKVGTSTRGKRS